MKSYSSIDSTLSNFDEDLKKIFDCEEKIKSLTSAYEAAKARKTLLEDLVAQIETTHPQRS